MLLRNGTEVKRQEEERKREREELYYIRSVVCCVFLFCECEGGFDSDRREGDREQNQQNRINRSTCVLCCGYVVLCCG